jgi:hypothetical protein
MKENNANVAPGGSWIENTVPRQSGPRLSKHYWEHGRLLSGSYKVPITIQCNSKAECDEVQATVKDPTFTSEVATTMGVSPAAFKSVSEPQMYETASFAAVVNIETGSSDTHTAETTVSSEAEAHKWKNATIALAVICAMLLLAVIGLAVSKNSGGGNSDAVKADDVEESLNSYNV